MPSELPEEYGVEILRAEIGSGIHGIAIKGQDDRDEMGVCIEHPRYPLGLDKFEQYVYRTAAVRESKHDARSQPGDLDLTIYGLTRFLSLAFKGNPNIVQLLFAPEQYLVVSTDWGKELQELRSQVLSRRIGKAYLGYLTAQKQKLLRERGTAKVPDRGDRDAKYAAHMLRLGYQGVELMETGNLTLPMPETERHIVREVKRGEIPINDVLNTAGQLEYELRNLLDVSPLPIEPNKELVTAFLLAAYRAMWAEQGWF